MNGIVFIRHAATDMAGTFCGHSDPPINAAGRQQIEDRIAPLASETWDAIYSSDLRRATTTAEVLTRGTALDVITVPNLREIHFGEWEGLTWDEIEQRDAAYARRWIDSFPALAAPAGESYPAFEQRILDEVEPLLHLAERKRIAVVTHAGVMRVVLRKHLHYNEQQAVELTRPYCSSFIYAPTLAPQETSR